VTATGNQRQGRRRRSVPGEVRETGPPRVQPLGCVIHAALLGLPIPGRRGSAPRMRGRRTGFPGASPELFTAPAPPGAHHFSRTNMNRQMPGSSTPSGGLAVCHPPSAHAVLLVPHGYQRSRCDLSAMCTALLAIHPLVAVCHLPLPFALPNIADQQRVWTGGGAHGSGPWYKGAQDSTTNESRSQAGRRAERKASGSDRCIARGATHPHPVIGIF